ncbi:MAG: hypothetical protein ABS32_07140 [Verrucomicrobia subdivision 6 bacterium BACL9 MAG-120820-bin42]|uniref:Uncharacterized protein n=1 Tax=Verrucomicrobia subdivision 6 bacterium BACL9 MAG-120820-bin42 TaxID=1655634 RepID=A0A0R2X6E2_9BACT|nr:MAG: hypothetical protein ABS32_07140 [Verrucomicrobia subdivision 6 bacterium BACL9 MAG-120820-bin42]
MENGGHVLFAEEEVAILHKSEAFGVEAAATIFHPWFGIRGVGNKADERLAVGIFVGVGGEMGLDGGGQVFFVGRDGDGVEAWGEDDGTVSRTAVGGEVEGF